MTSFTGEAKPSPHVVTFYSMLKVSVKYDRDMSAKFTDISHQIPASLLGVSAATREVWW
jgi:hypothetical protein